MKLAGVSEVAELLGVSKQRVTQLKQRPDFPCPIARLAAGPVWEEKQILQFQKAWNRAAGRRPK